MDACYSLTRELFLDVLHLVFECAGEQRQKTNSQPSCSDDCGLCRNRFPEVTD